MIRKTLAIRCNLCYNVIESTGKCYCENIAFIKQKGVWFIYSDNEDYSIVMVYKDDKGRRVKVVDVDRLKQASSTLPITEQVLDRIKPENLKKG